MFKKIICLIFILKLTQARYGFAPKFYGQDSAVIVDTDKFFTHNKNSAVSYARKIKMPPPFSLWRHYPRYRIVPQPSPGQIFGINTWANKANAKTVTMRSTTTTSSTTTTTTTTPKPTISSTRLPPLTADEFPNELLDIAQNKLGLKSLDEIPSISEFGQILGTTGPEETLNFIKQLTLNEQGIALMKAYIESTDYTDNTGDLNNNKNDDFVTEEEDDEIDDVDVPLSNNDEDLIVITDDESNGDYDINDETEQMENSSPKIILKTPKEPNRVVVKKLKELPQTHPSFMERLTNYMHLNNLFNKNEEKDNKNIEYNQLNRITENGKKTINKQKSQLAQDNQDNKTEQLAEREVHLKPPTLVRESIPYNYPVPIRVQTTTTTTSTETPASSTLITFNTPVVHLNTPKMFIPHIQQLSRVTKIPSKQIEDFLASKPKLLELATKVSRFSINYDRNSPIEAQVLAAVQKAFEQDDELQKLLSSTATLK